MKTNDNIATHLPEDVIELGVASVETKGGAGPSEATGIGLPMLPGISAE